MKRSHNITPPLRGSRQGKGASPQARRWGDSGGTMASVESTSTTLTPVDEACRLIWREAPRIAGEESVKLLGACGRVLAADIRAPIDVPPFANSAMDGYALRASDAREVPVTLPVRRRIAAGETGAALPVGEAARIFTGAALPPGADAVVIQEHCEGGPDEVRILEAVAPGDHVRQAGDSVRAGTLLFEAGHRLLPQDLGVLASSGIATIRARRRLRVGLLATGNELTRPGEPLAPGRIYSGNFHALASLLQELPASVADLGTAQDEIAQTRRILVEAAGKVDCIISTGGVSVGEEDHVRAAVEAEGELRLWKLAIKPGKPLAWGKLGQTAFFGLPGNPVSAFVTFVLIVRPALLAMMGGAARAPAGYRLPAGFSLPRSGPRQEYPRASLVSAEGSGEQQIVLDANQSSGAGISLSRSSGLLVLPPHTSVAPGDLLEFLPWSELLG